MQKHNLLVKNTFLYAIGPLLQGIISIALIPYYSFVLHKSEFGYYDLLVTSGSIISGVVTLKISDSLYRWLVAAAGDEPKQATAIVNSLLAMLAGTALVLLAMLFVPVEKVPYKWLATGYLISFMWFMHFQQLLRGLGFIKWFTFTAVMNALLLAGLNIVFLSGLHFRVDGILISAVLANAAGVLFILFITGSRFFKPRYFHRASFREMLGYSTPLVFNAINWWLMLGFDRYVLTGFLGLEANGIYAIAVKFASLLLLLNSFFIAAWQDHVLSNKAGTDYSLFASHYLRLQLCLVILLSAACAPLIHFFIDRKFQGAIHYIPLLSLASSLSAITSFFGTFLLHGKDTRKLFSTSLWGSLLNVAISLSLVKFIGIYAPCIAMVAGFLLTAMLRYPLVNKTFALHINWLPVLLLLVALGGVASTVYFENIFLSIAATAAALLLVFLVNKKSLQFISRRTRPQPAASAEQMPEAG